MESKSPFEDEFTAFREVSSDSPMRNQEIKEMPLDSYMPERDEVIV